MNTRQPLVFTIDLLRLALATAGDCLFLLALDGTIVGIDGPTLQPFGLDSDVAASGRSFAGLWADEARPALTATLAEVKLGEPVEIDSVIVLADGDRRHWSNRIVRLPTPTGDGDCILVVSRDVTDQRRAVAAMEKNNRLHRALIEATSEIVWHLDVTSNTCVRRGWAEFTGHDLPPDDAHCWAAFVHPADRDLVLRQVVAAMDQAATYQINYRLHHVSGTWRQVEDHAVPILDADGAVTDWIGIISDVDDRARAEVNLRNSEQRLRLAIEATNLGTWDVDVRTGRRDWSDELKQMLGLPTAVRPTEALLLDCIHPDDREEVAQHNITTFLQSCGTPSALFRVIRRDTGATRWIRSQGRVVLGCDGQPARRIGTFQDVTDQHETRRQLDLALRRYQALIDATSEIVWHANADQSDGDGNGWTEFTGQSADAANGDGWLDAVHPDDRATARDICHAAVAEGRPYTNQYRLLNQQGVYRWVIDRVVPLTDEAGRVSEWVGIISDIHDRRTAEEKVWRAAHTDDLTGLANRLQFQASLDHFMGEADRSGGQVGLILLDLDRFKEVNDSLGHDAGDLVLRTVAERITTTAPAEAGIARLGGDEFGILVTVDSPAEISALADGILTALRQPLHHQGRDIDCSGTIGYAIYPGEDQAPGALLKNADIALYAAKSAGRGQAFAFEGSMRQALDQRVAVLRNAREALGRDAIIPFYQPKVSLRTGEVIGFEALLRWHDGTQLRSPASIMEAFADFDLSVRLGNAMLAKVIADMQDWTIQGIPFGHVAVNLSAPEFHQPNFAGSILDRLAAAGLAPTALEVEVTETVLIENGTAAVSDALIALDAAGVAVSLDDFGTGFASLTHLKKHPVSWLKIDRSFISNLEADRDSAAIVQAVIGMARNIGIKVVAEGVETDWQYQFLQSLGCDVAQGYVIAKPMTASRVAHFLTERTATIDAKPWARILR